MSMKIYASQDWVEEKLIETQSDWNQNDETAAGFVKNRPFGIIEKVCEPITITWDGDTTDKVSVSFPPVMGATMALCKVSDLIPSLEQLQISSSYTISAKNEELGENEELSEELSFEEDIDQGIIFGDYVYIATKDNAGNENLSFPEKGIYFMTMTYNGMSMYVKSLAISGGSIPIIQKIDSKYLPVDEIIASVKEIAKTAKETADTAKQIGETAKETADTAKETADTAKEITDAKMNKINPTGTGTFSLNAKSGITLGVNSFTEGSGNASIGDCSHAEGSMTTASGITAHAEGYNTKAIDSYSHAEGAGTTASGTTSHAEGANSIAEGAYSHAEGINTTTSGQGAHAEGAYTIAKGNYSHVEGYRAMATGQGAHAEGYNYTYPIKVTGVANSTTYTLSENVNNKYIRLGTRIIYNNVISAINSYNPDTLTITITPSLSDEDLNEQSVTLCFGAFGTAAHTEGYETIASANQSHAEGSMTTASGMAAHSEGSYTIASASESHAEGSHTKASGGHSHAEGEYTIAAGANQHAQGKYNIQDSYLAHVVGNGTAEDARSNAHTLDWSGNAWYQGDVYVGSTSGTNKDSGSKKLATEEYVDNIAVQPNWNQDNESAPDYIKNKPFGETPTGGDTLLWDGDITDKTIVDVQGDGSVLLVKVSELMPPFELMQYGCTIGLMGQKGEVEFSQDQYGQIYIEKSPFLFVIPRDATQEEIEQGAIFKEKGIYFVKQGEIFIESLTIPGYTEFPGIAKIDRKYLPDYDFAGKRVANKEFEINGETVIANNGAEIFNNYSLNKAIGFYSHAEGDETIARGDYSHAEGSGTRASGDCSHAENYRTVASGENSHAEGHYTEASGAYSHAEGLQTEARGDGSHAEGRDTITENAYTHVEGSYNLLLNPPIEEQVTENVEIFKYTPFQVCLEQPIIDNDLKQYTASSMEYVDKENIQVGDYITSHAFDYETYYKVTSIENSDLYGEKHQLIIPSREKGKYAHILGNGTSNNNRSNAHTIDWEGNAWYQGDVYVSSTSGINKDEGSKKLATEEYVNTSIANKITVPQDAVAGDLLTYDGTNWVRISKADLIAEIIAALPNAEEASF